jgi:hypothetical protein
LGQAWYKKASVQTAIASGIFLVMVTGVVHMSPKRRLEAEAQDLKREIQRPETQLAPFRTLAVARFGGSEMDALSKLASQIRDVQLEVERASKAIRRLDVKVIARFRGDWTSAPPDLSNLFRRASDASDIRVQIETQAAGMRWVDFHDSSAPTLSAGDNNAWVLEYRATAPPGAWIMGVAHDELTACGIVDLLLYGLNKQVTRDEVIDVDSVVLVFYINGVAAYRAEYRPELRITPVKQNGYSTGLKLNGPTPIVPMPKSAMER